LWTNNSLQENYWNTENIGDKFITTEELRETLKSKKNGKSPGEDNLSSELYKYAGDSFQERRLFFLTTFR
jgi:hypothetical protein